MDRNANSHTRDLMRRQLHGLVKRLTTGDYSMLGPEELHHQIFSFLNRAHQLNDDNSYISLLRHFTDELDVRVPLQVLDEFLNRALSEKVLEREDYIELVNVRARLLMRREMGREILDLLLSAQKMAKTHYQRALLANREAVYWELKSNFQKSKSLYQRALDLSRASDDPRTKLLIAIVLNNLGNWAYAQDDFPAAIVYFQEALTQANKVNATRWQAAAAGGIAMTLADTGPYDTSFTYHELAEDLYRASGNTIGEVRINLNRSFLAVQVRRISDAKVWAYAALEGARQLDDAHRIASALHNLGLAYMAERDFVNALRFLEEAFHQRTALGQTVFTQNSIKAMSKLSHAIRQNLIG